MCLIPISEKEGDKSKAPLVTSGPPFTPLSGLIVPLNLEKSTSILRLCAWGELGDKWRKLLGTARLAAPTVPFFKKSRRFTSLSFGRTNLPYSLSNLTEFYVDETSVTDLLPLFGPNHNMNSRVWVSSNLERARGVGFTFEGLYLLSPNSVDLFRYPSYTQIRTRKLKEAKWQHSARLKFSKN